VLLVLQKQEGGTNIRKKENGIFDKSKMRKCKVNFILGGKLG